MVGSAILRILRTQPEVEIICRDHRHLDLKDKSAVLSFYEKQKIDRVFMAAARVGGIFANNAYPADFIFDNLEIQNNVIGGAFSVGVERLLFLGSSCIYPKFAEQPMTESALLTGQLEPTNEPYAIAKIAGIKLCESFNRQHGTDFRSVMPTNLYGINDNFHPENSHVIPALMRRFHEAKQEHRDQVVVWGTGKSRREFLSVDDMAAACVFVMNQDRQSLDQVVTPTLSHLNIGTGEDISIEQLALIMAKVVGYQGRVEFDPSKPDGTPRKLLDVSAIHRLGWHHQIDLETGLSDTYQWFQDNIADIRG